MRDVQRREPRAGRASREVEWPHPGGLVRLLVPGETTGRCFALVDRVR